MGLRGLYRPGATGRDRTLQYKETPASHQANMAIAVEFRLLRSKSAIFAMCSAARPFWQTGQPFTAPLGDDFAKTLQEAPISKAGATSRMRSIALLRLSRCRQESRGCLAGIIVSPGISTEAQVVTQPY